MQILDFSSNRHVQAFFYEAIHLGTMTASATMISELSFQVLSRFQALPHMATIKKSIIAVTACAATLVFCHIPNPNFVIPVEWAVTAYLANLYFCCRAFISLIPAPPIISPAPFLPPGLTPARFSTTD